MIFVDTGAWYALYVPRDVDHIRANEWRKSNRERLVTTDFRQFGIVEVVP